MVTYKFKNSIAIASLAALVLSGCGGPNTEGSHQEQSDQVASLFSRSNQNNAGYDAIKQSFDQFWAQCEGDLFLKVTTQKKRNKDRTTTDYFQLADVNFAVVEDNVSPSNQKNGQEFAGLLVFSDNSLYRKMRLSGTSGVEPWTRWYDFGGNLSESVNESKLERNVSDPLNYYGYTEYNYGLISKFKGEWFARGMGGCHLSKNRN